METHRLLRIQAWERAKGELGAALSMFLGEPDEFREAQRTVDEFVKKVEDNDLFD